MSGISVFLLAALQITMLDIVLCGDDIGVIALAIRNLEEKQKCDFLESLNKMKDHLNGWFFSFLETNNNMKDGCYYEAPQKDEKFG